MRAGRFALVAGVSLAMVLAACGSDEKESSATTAAAATTTAGGAKTTAAGGAATTAAGGAATTAAGGAATTAAGGECKVGVSWNNYQEERWAKFDEPAIKAAVEAGGGTYISNDAKSSAETQANNVENLISQGAERADHPRPGRHGHQAVRRQRDPERCAGDRL